MSGKFLHGRCVGFRSNDGIFIQTRLLLTVLFAHAIETYLNAIIKHKRVMEIQDQRLKEDMSKEFM
jgi:hypothetical protein